MWRALSRCWACLALGGSLVGCPVFVVVEADDPCAEVVCGPGASCVDDGVCLCDVDHIGDPDSADGCNPILELWITDACHDGEDIYWRVFSQDRGWAWPSADDAFVTAGLDVITAEAIECEWDELVCFGAAAGGHPEGLQWGLGLDGQGTCEDCCVTCRPEIIDLGALVCE